MELSKEQHDPMKETLARITADAKKFGENNKQYKNAEALYFAGAVSEALRSQRLAHALNKIMALAHNEDYIDSGQVIHDMAAFATEALTQYNQP